MTQQNQPQGIAIVADQKPFRIEETDGFVRLYLHGDFDHVEDNSKLISDLHSFSEKYNIIEVWISSNGGFVTMMNEIIEALKLFQTVVTICNSTASSAGAMIWGTGNVRVVSGFSQLMWHRESYGFYGKTSQHEDQLEHQKKVFPIMMRYCVGDILTEDEIVKAEYTEIHKTGNELVECGHAILFEEYKKRMNDSMKGRFAEVGMVYVDTQKGNLVLSDDSGYVQSIGIMHTSPYKYSFFDLGMSNVVRIALEDEEGKEQQEVEVSKEEFDNINTEYLSIFDEEDGEETAEETAEVPSEEDTEEEEVQ